MSVSDSQERRRARRHRAYLAAEVVIAGEIGHSAVTKDVSEGGLLLLTRARVKEGQSVRLKIHRPGEEDRPLEVTGLVVRREALSYEEIGTWREKVAVRFDVPQLALATEFEALAERQSRMSSSAPPASDSERHGV